MKVNVAQVVAAGSRIVYDDGRPGHKGVEATVLEVTKGHGMRVQFDDRADATYIPFSDARWMNFIFVVG